MGAVRGVEAAVRAALEEQRRQEPGWGVGVAHGERFVQWCRDDRGALHVVEVQPGGRRQDALEERGFVPHHQRGPRRLGILERAGGPLALSGSEDEVVAVLVDLLALLGVDDGSALDVFP